MGISISNATSSAITKYSVSLRSGEPDWSMIPVSYTHLELWDENAKYLKSIRESKNGYGFDDIGMGAAYASSTMYQKIVEG